MSATTPSVPSPASSSATVRPSEEQTSRSPAVPKRAACQACHHVKARCVDAAPPAAGSSNSTRRQCARCMRLNISCEERLQGPRGRKPNWIKSGLGAQQLPDVRPSPQAITPLYPMMLPSSGSPLMSGNSQHAPAPRIDSGGTSWSPSSVPATSDMQSPNAGIKSSVFRDSEPPELSLVESANARAAAAAKQPPPSRGASHVAPYPDPVDLKMLGIHEAEHLVASFHTELNPLIKILDRHLHTHTYLRSSSSILYAAVLAASAKFFRKDLYPLLLSQAQQMVERALGSTESHLGVIQSLCILIYWKEPHDRSAWMRVGWCLRLAYQLQLNAKRTTPLPVDHFEARLILDRERTWLGLICFESTYRLSHAFDHTPPVPLPMTSDIDRWVEESISFGTMDDTYLGASIEVSRIFRLISTLNAMPPASAEILRSHTRDLIHTVYEKYFDPKCPGARALGGTPPFIKTKMALDSTLVDLSRTRLTETNYEDPIAMADYSMHVSNLVSSLEAMESCEGFVDRLQDSAAITLFTLGEFLAKLFPLVAPTMQQSIVTWLMQILAVCNRCTGDRADGAPAFIARFYRLLLLHAVSVSGSRPSTRPGSPTRKDNEELVPAEEPYKDPFGELGWLVQEELETHQTSGQSTALADNEYWESLFPGAPAEVRNWLDPFQLTETT